MSTSDSKDKLTKEEKKLTKEEKKAYDKARANYFKGSISVMVIYGTFVLGLAILGIFSPSGRAYIFEQNFAFTVTFISGILVVITMMLVQLLAYKPPVKETVQTDALACPDYWELKKSTQAMKNNMNANVRQWADYYCQPMLSSVGIGTTGLVGIGTTIPVNKSYTDMVNKFNYTNGLTTSAMIDTASQMQCNRIFPDYMQYEDQKAFPDAPNTLRCKFLEVCGKDKISWSAVCPQ